MAASVSLYAAGGNSRQAARVSSLSAIIDLIRSDSLRESTGEARRMYAEYLLAACGVHSPPSKECGACEQAALLDRMRARHKSANFEAMTPSGVIAGERKGAFPSPHNGIVQIDLDHLGADGMDAAGDWAANCEHTAAAFASLSGSGLCVLMAVAPTPTTREEHHAAWDAAAAVWQARGFAPDVMNRPPNSLRFVGHDPDALGVLDAKPLAWEMPREAPKPVTSQQPAVAVVGADGYADAGAREYAQKVYDAIARAPAGQRHPTMRNAGPKLRGLVEAGRASESEVKKLLSDAMAAAGKDSGEGDAYAEWLFAAPQASEDMSSKPWTPPARLRFRPPQRARTRPADGIVAPDAIDARAARLAAFHAALYDVLFAERIVLPNHDWPALGGRVGGQAEQWEGLDW